MPWRRMTGSKDAEDTPAPIHDMYMYRRQHHPLTRHSVQSCHWHFLDTPTEPNVRVRSAQTSPSFPHMSEATSQYQFPPTSGTIAISGHVAATTRAYSSRPRYRRSVPSPLPPEVHTLKYLRCPFIFPFAHLIDDSHLTLRLSPRPQYKPLPLIE